MEELRIDDWKAIELLLPPGWKEAARTKQAFNRARYIKEPDSLLRLLLFHAINDGGLRNTVAQARASGIAKVSQVALLKRLRTAGSWLAWLSNELCRNFRKQPRIPNGLRFRAVDSTTVQGPASKGTEWRVHYALDLDTLSCDWCELTDAHGGELLERTPMQKNDVILGDRNYCRPAGIRAAINAQAHVLLRLRWKHSRMQDIEGKSFNALQHAKSLKVGEIGEWHVHLLDPNGTSIKGRVIVTRLPALIAAKAERRAYNNSKKKRKKTDPKTLEAAHFVMLFTTLSAETISADNILELYRFRWQIELAFKRLKQLLKLGRLPHKDARAAQGWILAKLVTALIIETLYRNARVLSPWGFQFKIVI